MTLRAFWQAFRRSPPPADPGLSRSRPPPGDNPVLAWLDTAGVPWRMTRAELATRFGVRTDNPYQWELVSLDVQPVPLDGMVWPFGFQAFERYNPAMPPERLSTHVWVEDDAETNIGHAAAQLGRVLGFEPVVDRYNTRHVQWRWEATLVSLTAWPRAMQSGPPLPNPAHRRDPRLQMACSVSVQTGWRPPLSPQERAWLDGSMAMGPTRNWTPAQPQEALGRVLSAETVLEFMRELPAGVVRLQGTFGLSADGEALVVCDDALYVLALDQVNGFEVTRTLPAKGGGGSTLFAVCNTGYAACPTKNVTVAQGAAADDLNDVAERLGVATGKPFRLGEYEYDT